MNAKELYQTLQAKFQELLKEHHLENEAVDITCRALSAEEAIGNTKRKDYPIITGKDIMIQAEYRNGRGQAFTDAPALFTGSLSDVGRLDIVSDSRNRGIFIASLNAVMNALGMCKGTVHCRTDGPEQCAMDMKTYLDQSWPAVERIGLIGYQPALLQMLAESRYDVRVLDLNPDNIGQLRHGVTVEDGSATFSSVNEWADLILCTGSTLCNGTIVDYLDLKTPVLFFGITAAGACELMHWNRVCFADRYER